MKNGWGALFFVVLVACTPSTVVVTQTQTAYVTPTNTPTGLSSTTAEIIPSPTALPPTPITPTIKIIASSEREVELSDLGLADSTRLILYYEPSESLRILSAHDTRPQKVPINSKSIDSYGIVISPNKKWFVYEVFKERRDGVAYNDIWISSIDGKEQNIAVSDVRQPTRARWATNEQLELWYYLYAGQCPYRELVVNPFTQEALNSPTLPSLTEPDCFFDLVTNPDLSKMLYRNTTDIAWNLYDFNTGKSQPVFPWLTQKESFTLWSRYVKWLPSGITLVLPAEDSIGFLIDLPSLSITDKERQLNKILLPASNPILWNVLSWVSLDDGLIGFDMIDYEWDSLSSNENTPVSKFVVLDLHDLVLYDYGFDRARTGDIQRRSDTFVYASVDKRFLAWTIYSPPGMGSAFETVVLERTTGKMARIKGFRFLGWGEVVQP